MFSLDFSFIKLYPLNAQGVQRDSFVKVLNPAITSLDGDVMPIQFKSVDEGYRLADLFYDLYPYTDVPPTSLDKSTLQEFFLSGLATNISTDYFNKDGVTQYTLPESRVVVPTVENIIMNLRYGYNAIPDGLYYFTLGFLTPAVLPAGLEDYQNQYVPLLKSDYIYMKNSPITKNERNFYTVFEYRSLKNAFNWVYGYIYSGEAESYTNRLRIPIELRNPQFKTKVENYKKSNGVYVRLASESEKEYLLETENLLDVDFHEALTIALLHDQVLIDNKRYYQSAEYEIAYTNERVQGRGKGKTKVVYSPYNASLPKF